MSDNQHNSKSLTQKNPPEKKSSGFGSFLVVLMSLLAILLASGGIAVGYKAWLDMNKRMDQAAVDRQSIAHEVETIDESIKLQNFKKQVESNVAKNRSAR